MSAICRSAVRARVQSVGHLCMALLVLAACIAPDLNAQSESFSGESFSGGSYSEGSRLERGRASVVMARGNLRRDPTFNVPARLKPRVDYWIDIFTRYGKAQAVLHHRHFPQAQFEVMDFSDALESLSDRAYQKHRTERVTKRVAEIEQILTKFSRGERPTTQFEQHVWDQMEKVPGGSEKYREAVKEELIRSQTGIKEKYAEAIKRSGRYLPHIEDIFANEFGLPVELTRLPFIESSFDYRAYSSVGAAGIWQFMRATGRSYMTINNYIDERRDVFTATRGAAKYLQSAYNRLGSWPLAITSYNHGVAGVYRKVNQLGTNDIVEIVEHPTQRLFGFASANFYPEFLAALDVYDDYQSYFPGVQKEPRLELAFFKLTTPLSVSYITRELDVGVDVLKGLNYAVSDSVWRGAARIPAGYVLKVPLEYKDRLSRLKTPETAITRTAPASSSIYGGVVYTVRRGDTLGAIARKYNTTVAKIKALNGLRSDTVRVGQRLVVRESEGKSTQEQAAKQAREQPAVKQVAQSSGKVHQVRSGDSLWSIGKKYGVTITQLKRANNMSGSKLKIGQKVKIP